MTNHSEIISFIWSVADLIRDTFKRGKYQDVILTFDHVAGDKVQDMIDSNFKFYKQITDDQAFAKALFDWLFQWCRRRRTRPAAPRCRHAGSRKSAGAARLYHAHGALLCYTASIGERRCSVY
jgi:hypothetical protein